MDAVYTLTAANLYAIMLVSLLAGGTLGVYGPRFLAWTDRRRTGLWLARRAAPIDAPVYLRLPNDEVTEFQIMSVHRDGAETRIELLDADSFRSTQPEKEN